MCNFKKNVRLILCIGIVAGCVHWMAVAWAGVGQYVKLAVENRKDIQIAREQVNLTKIRVVDAARFLGPSVLLQYRESDGETINASYYSKAYVLEVSQSVFTGGRKYNILKRELKGLEVAKNGLCKLEQEVKYEAIKHYYNVMLIQEKTRNLNELLEDLQDEFMISEKKYSVNVITEIEYLEVMDLKKEILLDRKMWELEFALKILDLKVACGIDFNVEVNLTEDFLEQENETTELSLEKYKEIALRKRPEIISLKAIVSQTKYDEKVAKADKWPGIFVEGSVGRSGEAYVREPLILATEWSVFGNVQWVFWGNSLGGKYGQKKTEPSKILDTSIRTKTNERFVQLAILDKLNYYYNKQEKKISHQQALKELDDTRKKVIIEVEKSYSDLKIALEMIKFSKERLKLYERKAKIVEKEKFLGDATSKDLIETKKNVAKQEGGVTEAICQYNVALAGLRLSCGMNVYPVKYKEK